MKESTVLNKNKVLQSDDIVRLCLHTHAAHVNIEQKLQCDVTWTSMSSWKYVVRNYIQNALY